MAHSCCTLGNFISCASGDCSIPSHVNPCMFFVVQNPVRKVLPEAWSQYSRQNLPWEKMGSVVLLRWNNQVKGRRRSSRYLNMSLNHYQYFCIDHKPVRRCSISKDSNLACHIFLGLKQTNKQTNQNKTQTTEKTWVLRTSFLDRGMHKQNFLSIIFITEVQHWPNDSFLSSSLLVQARFLKSTGTVLFRYFENTWWWPEASGSVNPAHSWINSKKN